MKINEIAAMIHRDMCENPRIKMTKDGDRWGDPDNPSPILILNHKYYIYPQGSYDASSSIIKAWELALQYTDYANSLKKAFYTGNMKKEFFNSGLFDIVHPIEEPNVGDIYLNETYNAMMVQPNGMWSGFFYDEFGSSGCGRLVLPADYDEEWDCVLRYNGLADKCEQ